MYLVVLILKLHAQYIFIIPKAKDELPQAVHQMWCCAHFTFSSHDGDTLLQAIHNKLCVSPTLCAEVHGRAESNRRKATAVLVGP
jgi:hypothetical protein